MGLRVQNNGLSGLDNPRLGFRLDPGEPGVLRTASASQSTLRVAEQENRNIRRLENEAIREGRIVTRSGATFTRTSVGSFTTTTSGLTRVESVEPRPTPLETAEQLNRPSETNVDLEAGEALGGLAASSQGTPGLFNNGFRFGGIEVQARERELVSQQSSIERELVRSARFRFNAEDPEAAQAARARSNELRRQAQEIERAINRIRLAQLAQSTAQLNSLLGEAAEAQARVAEDLSRAANGASAVQEQTAGIETPQFSIVI